MRAFFIYRRPDLAIAAVAALLFVVLLNIIPLDHLDKPSWLLASGLGIYFLGVAAKAVMNSYRNLAVLMFTIALTMVFMGVVLTSKETLAASALEDIVPLIVGGVGSFFTDVEERTDV